MVMYLLIGTIRTKSPTKTHPSLVMEWVRHFFTKSSHQKMGGKNTKPPFPVIQAVPFLSHNLSKRSRLHHPKKGTSRIARCSLYSKLNGLWRGSLVWIVFLEGHVLDWFWMGIQPKNPRSNMTFAEFPDFFDKYLEPERMEMVDFHPFLY